jgi:predicted amidohydrolase
LFSDFRVGQEKAMLQVRVAAAAIRSIPGNKAENLANIEKWATQARGAGAELICLPAMCVPGYWQTGEVFAQAEILKSDIDNPALVHPVGPSVKRLDPFVRGLGGYLSVGIVEDWDYYHLRNSVTVFGPQGHQGSAAESHTSIERHPTYVGGRDYPVFKIGAIPAGVVVGDDVFFPEAARILATQGAKLLIVAMATPVENGPEAIQRWRERMSKLLAVRAMENSVAVIAVEAAGATRNTVENAAHCFVGQAMAFTADGEMISQTAADNNEKILVVDLPIPDGECTRLARRRPQLYRALLQESVPEADPGQRQQDWDGQGELLWSRLRDAGYFCVDLNKEQGNSVVVVTGSQLPPLKNYRAVVLTRPCLAAITSDELKSLSKWVDAGGVLIIDGYCGRNADVLGPLVGIRGTMRREMYLPSYQNASRVTVRMQPVGPDAIFEGMDGERACKMWGQVWFPEKESKVTAQLLAHISSPAGERIGTAIYRNTVGRGAVYTFAYSSAYSQLLLIQGRGTTRDLGSFPERVAPNAPPDGDVCMWGDQVVTDSADQYFPSADYHLIPIINILRAAIPEHVLISVVPDGKECGVIFSGDSDRADADRVNQYTRILAEYAILPTQFVCCEGYDAKQLDPNCEYGLHPVFHENEEAAMRTLVSYGFDAQQIVCGRRHCLVQFGLTETLERMAECGIRYTSNNWDFPYPETLSTAFLYGTTLPHHIYNWAGKRIGIVDIPQVFMDYPPFQKCTEAAYRDVQRTHGVGSWNFHPQNLVMPEMKQALEWLAVQVRQDDVWTGTMGDYGDWYLQRDAVSLSANEQGVQVHDEPPKGLTLLSQRKELSINGHTSHANRSSMWYGRKYWVHVVPEGMTASHAQHSAVSKA